MTSLRWLFLGAWALLAVGCRGEASVTPEAPETPRAFKSLRELEHCRVGECVHASLRFDSGSPHVFAGRLPYVTEFGHALHSLPVLGVRRVIVALHGVYGTTTPASEVTVPPGLFQFRAVDRAFHVARRMDRTLRRREVAIIAPTFQRTGEWTPFTERDPRAWHWERSTWLEGDVSGNAPSEIERERADPVSSFRIFDEMLLQALHKFPDLEQIVIVGHSAGGQAVQRYAILGTGMTEYLEARGVGVRYVAANPGSYAYITPVRKLPPRGIPMPELGPGGEAHDWDWRLPRGCGGYDDWEYGLNNLTDLERGLEAAEYALRKYLRRLSPQAWEMVRLTAPETPIWARWARAMLVYQYGRRDLWHLQAASDLEPYRVEKCVWRVQGRSRVERFSHFQDAWEKYNPFPKGARTRFIPVEDLDSAPHSSNAIYASPDGIRALFH